MPTSSFAAHMATLSTQAAQQGAAAAAPGVLRRPWQLPLAFPNGTDVQTPSGIMYACNRSTLNAECVEAYTLGGRVGLIVPYKLAIDYQGAYERALHARYASAVRCRVWAGARRAGHGDSELGVFGAIQRDLASRLAAATAVSAGSFTEAAIAATAAGLGG